MTLHTVLLIFNFSITIPALLLIFRISSVKGCYWPFAIFIWAGLLNDVLSYLLILKNNNNMVNSNLFTLVEYTILLFQFAIWKGRQVWLYLFMGILGFAVWLVDNMIMNTLNDNNSVFRLFYSLVIVLFSMDIFNKLVVYARAPLGKNSSFLICIGIILFFSSKAFLEAFNIFQVGLSDLFFIRLFLILSVINLLSNLLYAYAILCIPKKQEFTLPY